MRRTLKLLGALSVGFTAAGLPSVAEAQELRYTETLPGNVIAFGNTLGLAKETSLNGPGLADSIGTFISLDGTSLDTDLPLGSMAWPLGTTSAWLENGSTATVELPIEGQVLYAELVWGGSYQYGTEDVTALLDSSVTLSFGGDSIVVAPDPTTATTIAQTGSFVIRYYMRSSEVTDFIDQHGSGTYSVSGVPATQGSDVNTVSAGGWSVIVAYRNDTDPIRNLSVFVGDTAFVDEDATVDYQVDGFCAPPIGMVTGTIAVATIEGDSNREGDQLAIGQTPISAFVNLSGPNNPANNFFCSQINGPNGAVDTTGSFGNRNHSPGSNTSGGRQGWDVAHVQLSSSAGQLFPAQTSAVLRTQTLSDSYMPVLAGIAIDVNAPTFGYQTSTTSVDPATVELGDTFNVTVTLSNQGSAIAEDVRFALNLDDGLALSSFTTDGNAGDINGDPVALADVETGVEMGDVAPNGTRTVSLELEVTTPQDDVIPILPLWSYSYTMCVGSSIDESFTGEVKAVTFIPEEMGGAGGGGEGGAGGGVTAGGGGGGTGGISNNGGGPTTTPITDGGNGGAAGGDGSDAPASDDEEGGCDCKAAAGAPGSGDQALLLVGLAALGVMSRRKRR